MMPRELYSESMLVVDPLEHGGSRSTTIGSRCHYIGAKSIEKSWSEWTFRGNSRAVTKNSKGETLRFSIDRRFGSKQV
jgi:hypothetical protein